MRFKTGFFVLLLVLTACGNANLPSDTVKPVIENTNITANKYSKELNINERKETRLASDPSVREKLSIKDLPSNFMYLPLTRQATDYTCGVASLQSILMYYGDEYMESELAQVLKADPENGTSYHNIADFSKSEGYTVNIYKKMSIEDLKKQIDNKKPVLVLLQAWSDDPNPNYKDDWIDGHYSIAIGYDQKRVYFMDPSTLGYYTFIPTQQFLDRWHDVDINEKVIHFGMVIEKKNPKYNRNDVFLEG